MRVDVSGWRRNCGVWTLIETDLLAVEATPAPEWFDPHLTHLYKNEFGEACVAKRTPRVTLNGNFRIDVRLSREDAVALARVALKDASFGEVLQLFSRKGPANT